MIATARARHRDEARMAGSCWGGTLDGRWRPRARRALGLATSCASRMPERMRRRMSRKHQRGGRAPPLAGAGSAEHDQARRPGATMSRRALVLAAVAALLA